MQSDRNFLSGDVKKVAWTGDQGKEPGADFAGVDGPTFERGVPALKGDFRAVPIHIADPELDGSQLPYPFRYTAKARSTRPSRPTRKRLLRASAGSIVKSRLSGDGATETLTTATRHVQQGPCVGSVPQNP